MSDPRRTPLYGVHQKLGARLVEFAGWEMPIQYEGVKPEHLNVRENVGLFDVSHMGEIFVRGEKALETLQWLTTNDVSKLSAGQAQYSLFPNAEGGIVDDLIVYCIKENQEYLLCVNAANTAKDLAFLQENNRGSEIVDESAEWAQIAIQGPKAMTLLERVFSRDFTEVSYFHFTSTEWQGHTVLLARTGYTGEDGVEVFIKNESAEALWWDLTEKGQDLGVKPIGLAARDTLRTEMKYCLYGQEIDDQSNPYSAGLGWVVKPKAKDFLGKEKMLAAKAESLKQKLVAFRLQEKGIPRPGYGLVGADQQSLGKVTSGTMSPSLNLGIGIGYISSEFAAEGSEIFVDIRGRSVKAEVVKAALTKK